MSLEIIVFSLPVHAHGLVREEVPDSPFPFPLVMVYDERKTKVRPLLASSEKSEQGRKIWEEMEAMGVIERVDPSTLTDYSSALHLVRKPSGKGWRPCVDFRPINLKTKSDSLWPGNFV